MLDNQQLRNDLNGVVAQLKKRGFDFDVNRYTALEDERKITQTETEALRAKRNALSKQIGIAKGKGEDVSAAMTEVAGLGARVRPQRRQPPPPARRG